MRCGHKHLLCWGVYSNTCASAFGEVGRKLLSLPYFIAGVLVSLWKETSAEKINRHQNGPCYERYVLITLGTPVLLALFLISVVPAGFGLVFYSITLPFRKRIHHHNCNAQPEKSPAPAQSSQDELHHTTVQPCSLQTSSIAFLTANTCLMPTFLAKYNNLSDTRRRARHIGEQFAVKQTVNLSEHSADVIDHIPSDVTFLCLQEVFDRDAAAELVKVLQESYPYIIWSADSNDLRKILNSGLFFASKFPILRTEFRGFAADSGGADVLADKGLLSVMVDLNSLMEQPSLMNMQHSSNVGFIFITHLQAHEGEKADALRWLQLSNMRSWMDDFRERAGLGCHVAFDILCGDLNRTWKQEEPSHDLLNEYEDTCPQAHQWPESKLPPGTEMRQSYLHMKSVSDPSNMRCLLLGIPDDDNTVTDPNDFFFGEDGRKQIDHILLNKSHLSQGIQIDKYAFVTALAGYTDHVPVYMRLKIKPRT